MRETKFRVWSKENDIMLDWSEILDAPDFEEFMRFADKEDGAYSKLMQYIGLRDVHGTEVYEGDIVDVWRGGNNRKFVVKWREEGVPMYILYPQPLNEDFWQIRSDMQMSWKVIGNIYKNPELLK